MRLHLRQGGLAQVLAVASSRQLIPGWLAYLCQIDLFALDDAGGFAFADLAAYDYGIAVPEDVARLVAITDDSPPERLSRLFTQFMHEGNRCHVARRGEAIVAYMWAFHSRYTISTDGHQSRLIHLLLRPGEVFLGNGYIARSHRMRGLFPALLRRVLADYPPRTVFYSSVDRLNRASAQAHRRFGFARVGSLRCWRLASSPYLWMRSTPAGGWRLLAAGRATVELGRVVPNG